MSDYKHTEHSRVYGVKIVRLCRELRDHKVELSLTSQLLRCGTSIGANIHEAQYAQGTRDFVSKLEIALKECHETQYWLTLLHDLGDFDTESYNVYRNEAGTIRRVLIASIRTSKNKLPKENP